MCILSQTQQKLELRYLEETKLNMKVNANGISFIQFSLIACALISITLKPQFPFFFLGKPDRSVVYNTKKHTIHMLANKSGTKRKVWKGKIL